MKKIKFCREEIEERLKKLPKKNDITTDDYNCPDCRDTTYILNEDGLAYPCKCKAKVFTRMSGNLKTQIGQPDLIILFTSTVAHKMVHCALKEAERYNIRVERAHSSSASALENVLQGCC